MFGIRRGFSVASFTFFLCVLAASASAQTSTFEHLARPQFTSNVRLDGISADGSRVVATFNKIASEVGYTDYRSVTWDAAGTVEFLDLLPEPGSAGIYATPFRQPISADGSLIGGYCSSDGIGNPPVSWDADGAIRQLPSPFYGSIERHYGHVSAVSGNGAYLYGWCGVPSTGDFMFMPFRWNAAGEATMLQSLSGDGAKDFPTITLRRPVVSATSFDGTIAVGTDYPPAAVDGDADARPVRWNADGSVEALRLLGTDADGHAQGTADLCSADGSVVVGLLERYSSAGAYLRMASVCWLPDGRVLELSGAHRAMTPDGKTIVGDARYDLVDGQIVTTELGFTSFGVIYANDVSDDGRVIAGGGSGRSDHPGARVWIDNRMHSLEELLAKRGVKLPAGWVSLDSVTFCSADGTVFVGEGTFGTERTAFRATIPDILVDVDEDAPVLETLAPIRTFCDPGKTFASVTLIAPRATDDFPGEVVVTTTAKSPFPIGTTNVLWKATDAAGNVAQAVQKVTVVNRKPRAHAGKNVTIVTKSERGARVRLDGSRSSDPDKHRLKYAWKAKRVKFAKGTTPKPSGIFKVGRTTVTLTVTDAGGLKRSDTVRVNVRLKNARRRPRGSDANRSFAAAAQQAEKAVAAERSGSAALSGLAYASAAAAYGDAAGEFVRWEEGQSEEDAAIAYAEMRALQATYGQAAAKALLAAYAETGDESLLSAYGYAAYGTAYAAADLSEE